MAGNLMIQGTMSGAGKSILTAGILRVLRQDGYRVAPFKSQNMALNSYVTREGLEMGRAQVVQAAAAGMEPSADMNPILLKPMGDTTSQVIVNGRPIGKMRAADYYKVKKSLVPNILAAYERLRERADIIVIEGAGSPVEINLREGDFVNMGLAEMVDAPVLLAGNIDPGGVFAQLLGTIQLLRPEERARVKGLIINKFRGDVSLLQPGLDMFAEYCDIPFAGVVPWIRLDLDEEDSMSEKLAGRGAGAGADTSVDIAVIRLPYISNYTDFAPLERLPGVTVRYVAEASLLGQPDLIILPGTKNSIGDLRWLRESGMEARIRDAAGRSLLIGICGGFQMLGRRILDPLGSETGGTEDGLGLLSVETLFSADKYTRQVHGTARQLPGVWAPLSGLPVSGYEIHMGRTEYPGDRDKGTSVFAQLTDGGPDVAVTPVGETPDVAVTPAEENPDGAVCGNVLGTYLHGVFDETPFRSALIDLLRKRKEGTCSETGAAEALHVRSSHTLSGRESAFSGIESARQIQDRQLDMLADVLRESLDWELIYRAIGI
ncbi:MAG: cobyric acid synthase [Lachnospiraceae bacterium]|nr:cobyric acid synthase [Lachnospiraceae bacterium]